jgi:hypothetical protein
MPPNTNSVIDRTRTPRRCAVRLCPSSCRTIEAKKRGLVTSAALHEATGFHSGCAARNWPPNENVINRKIRSQLWSIASSIPRTRPIDQAVPPKTPRG